MDEELRRRIKKALIDRGQTQAQFAEEVGTTPSYFGMILGGKHTPGIETALKILEALFGASDATNATAIKLATQKQEIAG